MVEVRAIRSEEDYDAALTRITELMNALSGPEGQVDDVDDPNRVELDVLTDLVDLYEERNYPIGFPDPISAIMFRMDQANLTPRDLVPFIGSRAKVSEVLSGKRAHHHVHSSGASPTLGNTSRSPFAKTGSQLAGHAAWF